MVTTLKAAMAVERLEKKVSLLESRRPKTAAQEETLAEQIKAARAELAEARKAASKPKRNNAAE